MQRTTNRGSVRSITRTRPGGHLSGSAGRAERSTTARFSQASREALALSAALASGLLLIGCAAGPDTARATPANQSPRRTPSDARTSVVAIEDNAVDPDARAGDGTFDEIASAYEQLNQRHGSILGPGGDQRRRERPTGAPPVANVTRQIEITPLPASPDADETEDAGARPSGAILATHEPGPLVVPDPDPAMRARERARLTSELAQLLVADAGDPRQATQALMTLAALELIEPGVLNTHVGQLNAGGHAVLPTRDRQVVTAWRDFFREARTELNKSGDAAALAELADKLTLALDAARSLAIPSAALCTKVEGFGVYAPLPNDGGTYRLLAGRRHRVIVYAELKHFMPTPVSRGGYEVELSQDLALYHYAQATDTLAWQRTGEEIRDVSRNRRQDFFTAQIIDLPETLSVGTYRLKITVRDRKGGGVAERVIPIEIVAHPSALGPKQ